MGRLIDEDDVLKVLCHELCHPGAICPDGYCEEMREMLKDVPTAHPEPPKIGKWIVRDNPGTGWYRITCSECGEDVTSVVPTIGFMPNVHVLWNFCPECGAKMEENKWDG